MSTVVMFMGIPFIMIGEQALYWNAPQRSQKVSALIPGARIHHPDRDVLYRDWTEKVVKEWANSQGGKYDPAQDFLRFQNQAPHDQEITSTFPRHISPYARLVEGRATREERNAMMLSRCPVTGEPLQIQWSPANPLQLKLSTGFTLYSEVDRYPADSPFKPDRVVRFSHLDKEVEVPAVHVRDPKGRVWEIYPTTLVDYQRWLYTERQVFDWYQKYMETGNPLYVHKTAVMLDQVAEVYWGLPPAYLNDVATNPDGTPLTREDWENLESPRYFEQSDIGIWQRFRPSFGNRGWISIKGSNWNAEYSWVEPFARMRHHPAFKQVSKEKYGSEEALDQKVSEMLIREIAHLFKVGVGHILFSLIQNYQNADYTDLYLLAILAEDQVLLDFAGPAQEVELYNHHYHDGMAGEGAPNYMAHMRFFYSNSGSPEGWLSFDPGFLARNPFFATARAAYPALRTMRNLPLEFGDQHVQAWPPSVRRTELLREGERLEENARIRSRFWPGYGLGILRSGHPDNRMESLLTFTRASLHGKSDVLGRDLWVDGIPVIRRGGYASGGFARPYRGQDKRFEMLKEYDYPYPIRGIRGKDPYWYRNFAASPLMQNSVVIDGVGSNYYREGEGLHEAVWIWQGFSEEGARPVFQVLEAENKGAFEVHGIDVQDLRRTLLTVESPGGRACMLDITLITGGEQRLLFNTVWGDSLSAASQGESRFENLAAWLKALNTEWIEEDSAAPDSWIGGRIPLPYFGEVTDLSVTESVDRWQASFITDYAAWAPREQDGRFRRPFDGEEGVVSTWIRGLFPPGQGYRLLEGRGPWIARVNQQLPDGKPYDGNVAFDGALGFVILEHQEPDGQSVFIQLLEGARGRVDSEIKDYRLLKTSGSQENTVAVEILWMDGSVDWIVYQKTPAPLVIEGKLHTDARYAWVRSKAGKVLADRLVGGTFLQIGEWQRSQSASVFSGEVLDVIGDITGIREESALIVRPQVHLEDPQSLVGSWIAVDTPNPVRGSGREQYKIERVERLDEQRLKLVLEGYPPFVKGWHNVGQLVADSNHSLLTNRPLQLGSNTPWKNGDWVWFPEKDKRYRLVRAQGGGGGVGRLRLWLEETADLRADGIERGDWFVIHALEPGAHVSVIQATGSP